MAVDLYEKTKARLAREIGAGSIDAAAAVKFALAFPNVYRVGMASLGYQLVYRMLNDLRNASAERVFLPDDDDLKEHIRARTEIFTLEHMRPLSEFHAIAFSISFEMDYLNVLRVLKLANLPVECKDRDDFDPLIIAGGPCATFNPEPLADIVDAFVIGDAEHVLADLVNAIESTQGKPREEILTALARVSGVYVPTVPKRVQRAVARDLSPHASNSIIRAVDAEFGDITLVEMARGCGRKCRFCLAGHITRPPRLHEAAAPNGIPPGILPGGHVKAARLGLVGAAVFDYPEAERMCAAIVDSGGEFTVSSVRLETVTPEIARLMAAGGQKTLTIAPEAGSARLRRVINKNTTDEDIFSAVTAARDAGIGRIKLYFMIGLPTETADDIDAIIELVRRLASSFPHITFQVSASSFVPKPWTPFQWCAMERESVLKKRYAALRSGISSIRGAQFGGESPRLAAIQALFARGDRRLGRVLIAALANDGDYSAALRETGIDSSSYLYKERARDELLPWDHLDMLISKDYLWSEYENALAEATTPRCDIGACRACGACI